jgi:ribulose bisphosphate carboxylase small subunit
LADVEEFIRQHLCGDWVLRVEHADRVEPRGAHWQQWGKALFAIWDPEPVVAALAECQGNHPTHTVRLCAEKSRPGQRLVYWI